MEPFLPFPQFASSYLEYQRCTHRLASPFSCHVDLLSRPLKTASGTRNLVVCGIFESYEGVRIPGMLLLHTVNDRPTPFQLDATVTTRLVRHIWMTWTSGAASLRKSRQASSTQRSHSFVGVPYEFSCEDDVLGIPCISSIMSITAFPGWSRISDRCAARIAAKDPSNADCVNAKNAISDSSFVERPFFR